MISVSAVPVGELPSRKARWRILYAVGIVAALVVFFVSLRVNPLDLFTRFHYLRNLAGEMLPPNISVLWTKMTIWSSIGETLSMAYLGTLVGIGVCFGSAILAAANTTPHPLIRLAVRGSMAVERAITSFFILLVLLIALGLGPLAGTLTIAGSTFGLIGRLFADAIEQADMAPCEAILATGATRSQMIALGVLPQVLPALISQSLYAFDINLRVAVALGLFGAGGLGFELHVANNMLRYRDVLGYTLITMALLSIAEFVSDALRKRILITA